ncbi:mechanosensitive ion channel family protein [Halorussus gelatinilyticus]|uniref:Mechanosensitive ion channel family protein n=1 Tax=Halorussus gelatinilyticus TaxID=2937524 RepID=A0A8U0II63_9EURY|nr:mechanosensitive ion channel family protein [Halorussus gelatinilyticus]UPW00351.1 mechanosensitive ion channel family protein [Halorussus gelatinilyticus]
MVTVAEAIERFLETYRSLPGENYLTAALILVVAWYGSRLLIRFLGRPVARRFQRPSLTKTVLSGIRAILMVFAASVAANQVGFRPGDILLSVTVFSAVLGLVLAPIIGSVINGLFLLADQPYEVGDMIKLVDRDQRGYVEDITLRYTKIFTLENTFLVIPNSNMRDRDVINYSAEDTRSRLSLELLVTYEGNVEQARAIMERAARETTEVVEGGPDIRIGSARYPSAPVSYVKEFADHGVLLDLRYWVKDPYYLPRVTSKINERIWSGIEDADVEIAYPHQHLVFDETSGTASVEISEGGRRGSEGERRARRDAETESPAPPDDENERSPPPEEFDSPD